MAIESMETLLERYHQHLKVAFQAGARLAFITDGEVWSTPEDKWDVLRRSSPAFMQLADAYFAAGATMVVCDHASGRVWPLRVSFEAAGSA